MSPVRNVTVLISGTGSNLQAIIDGCADGSIDADGNLYHGDFGYPDHVGNTVFKVTPGVEVTEFATSELLDWIKLLLAEDIPNLIVTPHIAWAAREARQRAVNEIAANIDSYLSGGRRCRIV